MARELKPCGTTAAYRRHLRAGEEPCEACLTAAREDVNRGREERRAASSRAVLESVMSAPPVDDFDPLRNAEENLRLVKATLESGPPANTVAQLSKRWQELVSLINELKSDTTEVSLSDELAAVRARRETGT